VAAVEADKESLDERGFWSQPTSCISARPAALGAIHDEKPQTAKSAVCAAFLASIGAPAKRHEKLAKDGMSEFSITTCW
jgi:hypothetical protein